jgi:DNA-binding NarL/FixJ family response regulator
MESFDGMILDLRLPDIGGIEILERTMFLYDHVRVVILSGHASSTDFERCIELGAIACFQKPANIKHLVDTFQTELK